jgi:uncharacterized protein (DUF58 family)
MPVFDTDFLQKLEYLSLLSRRMYHGQMLAQRATRQRGSGSEFADHQAYTAGDDFRYLDWNVYARHGELLLKRFHEERDLCVKILVDASRSMSVGSPVSKFDYARRVTAALAYIALAQLDRVTVSVFAEDVVATFPETRGKSQILTLMRFLERQQTVGSDTCLEAAAIALTRQSGTGGLAIVVSDFLDPHGFERALDRLRYHQCEIYLVHLYDPSEADPALSGDLELVDIETGASRLVTVRQRDARRYRAAFDQFTSSLQQYARRRAVGYLGTSTQVPYDELILKTMRRAGWLAGA